MEAISILEEAQSIARGNNSAKLCKIEKSRLECLQGQVEKDFANVCMFCLIPCRHIFSQAS